MNPFELKNRVKNFLERLSAHIRLVGGEVSPEELREKPLGELLEILISNKLNLIVDNDILLIRAENEKLRARLSQLEDLEYGLDSVKKLWKSHYKKAIEQKLQEIEDERQQWFINHLNEEADILREEIVRLKEENSKLKQRGPHCPNKFKDHKEAAVWLMKVACAISKSQVAMCEFISRRGNNKKFEIGFFLKDTARRIWNKYEDPPTERRPH